MAAFRPLFAVLASMALVMIGILIGSRLPGRDVTLPFPTGIALDYAGAPAGSFFPLGGGVVFKGLGVARNGGGALLADSAGQQGSTHGCAHDAGVWTFAHPCDPESPTAQSSSVEYIATPAGVGVDYENAPASISGQIFTTPTGPFSIKVADRNGAGVAVTVCQSKAGGLSCSGAGSLIISFCSTAEPRDLSAEGFKPGFFRVRIDSVSTSCPTVATTGTITVYW